MLQGLNNAVCPENKKEYHERRRVRVNIIKYRRNLESACMSIMSPMSPIQGP